MQTAIEAYCLESIQNIMLGEVKISTITPHPQRAQISNLSKKKKKKKRELTLSECEVHLEQRGHMELLQWRCALCWVFLCSDL